MSFYNVNGKIIDECKKYDILLDVCRTDMNRYLETKTQKECFNELKMMEKWATKSRHIDIEASDESQPSNDRKMKLGAIGLLLGDILLITICVLIFNLVDDILTIVKKYFWSFSFLLVLHGL